MDEAKNPYGPEAAREIAANKSCIAHLIHGNSEGRFQIRYCPGELSREEIEGVGFMYGDLGEYTKRYLPNGTDGSQLKDGFEMVRHPDGTEEEVFFVSNPAIGLWAYGPDFE